MYRMIYLELSDSAGDKVLELDGTFSVRELIDLIAEELSDGDETDDEEDSESESESEMDSEEEIRQMKAEMLWLDLGRDVD